MMNSRAKVPDETGVENQERNLSVEVVDRADSEKDIQASVDALKQCTGLFDLMPVDDCGIVVCGDTGSGKSTLINYLNKKSLILRKLPGRNRPVLECSESKGVAGIGHQSVSMTSLPEKYEIDGIGFWDFPGFEDTEGGIKDVVNAYSKNRACKKIKHIKVLAVIEHNLFEVNRGQGLRDLIDKLDKMFCSNKNLKQAIALCITKSRKGSNYNRFILDEVVNSNENKIASYQKSVLSHLVKNNQIVELPSPSKDETGSYDAQYEMNLIRLIDRLQFLSEPKMELVVRPRSLPAINKLMEFLNDTISEHLNKILSHFIDDLVLSGGRNQRQHSNFFGKNEVNNPKRHPLLGNSVDKNIIIFKELSNLQVQYEIEKTLGADVVFSELEKIFEKNIGKETAITERFKEIDFLLKVVLHQLVEKFLGVNILEYATVASPFSDFLKKVNRYLLNNDYSKEDRMDFIKNNTSMGRTMTKGLG